jgi:A/G-specific adenine glycosylase
MAEAPLMAARRELIEWFRRHGRRLPWRVRRLTPFQYLVTEKLLQQTTVTHVLKVYDGFLERYGEAGALASASERELSEVLRPLGFYSFRARELVRMARDIMEKFSGRVPEDLERLKELPGVGEYTAKAVLIAAFGKRLVAVDENLKRLGGRLFYGVEKASRRQVEEVERRFLEMMGDADPREFNWALLDLAWAVCKKRPLCGECPLSRFCRYYSIRGGTRR